MIDILDSYLMDRANRKFFFIPDNFNEKLVTLTRIFLSDGSFSIVSPDAYLLNSKCLVSELEVGDEIPFPKFRRERRRKISTEELTQIAPFEFDLEDFRFHFKGTIHYLPDTIHLTAKFGRLCGLLAHRGFNWYIAQKENRLFQFEPQLKFRFSSRPEQEEEIKNLFQECLGISYKRDLRHNLLIYLLALIGFEKSESIIPPNIIRFNDSFVGSLVKSIFEDSTFLPFHLASNLFFILNSVGLRSSMFREGNRLFEKSLVAPFENRQKRSVVFLDQISSRLRVNSVERCITNSGCIFHESSSSRTEE